MIKSEGGWDEDLNLLVCIKNECHEWENTAEQKQEKKQSELSRASRQFSGSSRVVCLCAFQN